MKEIFEGAINGVKYTDPEAFQKAMDELVKSNKSFSSVCSKKVVKENDNQLDLFDDSVVSTDNIFPSIDQALEKLTNGELDYNLLKEINNDLDERKEYLKDNICKLYSPDVMKRLNVSKDMLNNRKRLIKSEIDRLINQLDVLENELEELDRVRYVHLNDIDKVGENIEKMDMGKDIIDSFEDYYEDCLEMLYDHNTCKEQHYPEKPECNSVGECRPIPGKVECKDNSVKMNNSIDLENLMKFFEDLWK